MKFRGKTVLVTGSSRGLGKEIALGFADEGANVVINYKESKEEAESLASEIQSKGTKSFAVRADVSDIDSVKHLFQIIEKKLGKLDVLINNAATYEDSVVWKMSNDRWDRIIQNDLTSVFNCTKLAVRLMRQQNYGRIVNISSVVGQTRSFGSSNYAAAKSGILGFTRAVSTEVANKQITVNALSLGFIETGMLLRLPPDIQNSILTQIPLGRWGHPKEVVSTVIFLSSEEAGYITGQVINLNGGYYM